MGEGRLYKIFIVCIYGALSLQGGIANAYTFPNPMSDGVAFTGKSLDTVNSTHKDTLTIKGEHLADSLNNAVRSTGLLFEILGGGINAGFRESDYLIGINQRHVWSRHFFGEGRVAIGMITDNVQKVRFIPAVYRLNYRLRRQAVGSSGQSRLLSPYLYLGAGLIYHKPVEITPPVDPRTGRLEGRLPSSSLFSFESGITPMLPVGAGVNMRLDPSVILNLQFGYQKVLNQLALRGDGFRREYFLGFTIGLNFGRSSPSKAPPVSKPSYQDPRRYPDNPTIDHPEVVEEEDPVGDEPKPVTVTSDAFNILVGRASRLSFEQQPTHTRAGVVIHPPVIVHIEDRMGNLVRSDNRTEVTMVIGNDPSGGSATLMGTTTVTARNGVATFNDLSINAAGEGYMLEAIAPGLTGATMTAGEKQPTAPVFPAGMRVDTVRAGQCRYSVQIGGYQTMGAAFSAVDKANAETGHFFELYYNRRNGLYMVRTSSSQSFSDVVRMARNFERSGKDPEVAVVHQCYEDPSVEPRPVSYQIQLGAFQNPENAEKYAQTVRKTYRVDVSVQETEDNGLFRVRTRPSPTISEARRVLKMLKNRGLGNELFLTPTPESTRFAMNFEYDLHAGTYSRVEDAIEQAEKLRSEVGFDFRMVVTEEEESEFHLFLDIRTKTWKELLKVKNENESSEFVRLPLVINLMES